MLVAGGNASVERNTLDGGWELLSGRDCGTTMAGSHDLPPSRRLWLAPRLMFLHHRGAFSYAIFSTNHSFLQCSCAIFALCGLVRDLEEAFLAIKLRTVSKWS